MKTLILKCPKCGNYTMNARCPVCGSATISSLPPRFSPQDRFGKYRMRILYGKE
ncbi:MAG: RNA-protein complex protein Nop10 [Thermoplasmatales archaeon]